MHRTAVVILLVGLTWSALAEPVVKAPVGQITGSVESFEGVEVESFKGIPFAKPPVGELRFAMPVPFGSVGDFQAKNGSPMCPQKNLLHFPQNQSEDCLQLNVFRQAGTAADQGKAVVIFIHGGGFAVGSAEMFDAIPLVALQDLIVVTIQYRLGIFGFAFVKDLTPGNLGFFDQRLTMEWVQQNIKAFGGDPKRVTLFGVSAGSMSVSAQINTPLNRGKDLFQAAILDAGVVAPSTIMKDDLITKRLTEIALKLSCNTDDATQMLSCLRAASAENLTELAYDAENFSPILTFLPNADGTFLVGDIDKDIRENSKDYVDVRIMVGTSTDEGTQSAGYEIGANSVPPLKTREEFVEWLAKLISGLNFPFDKNDEKVREMLIDLYFNKTSSRWFDVAEFVEDVLFLCPTNAFVSCYGKDHDKLRVFYFARKLRQSAPPFMDPEVNGVFHSSPTVHMAGQLLRAHERMPNVKPIHEDDRAYTLDCMKLAADFVKGNDSLTFRGVEWPVYRSEPKIFVFDEVPSIQNEQVNPEHCARLFPSYGCAK